MTEFQTEIDAPGVLLVDPLTPVRLSIREILINSGFYVIGEASDAQQAVILAKRIRPDLVIISAKLGSESGIDVLRSLRGIHPGLKAILLTSNSLDVLAAAQMGEPNILVKPVNRLRLLELARSMIGRNN
jgi:DNA-binding NarL/FixJ family response regulator